MSDDRQPLPEPPEPLKDKLVFWGLMASWVVTVITAAAAFAGAGC